MDALESLNRSVFLFINGSDGTPPWLVSLALVTGEGLIYAVPLLLTGLWLWGDSRQRRFTVLAFAVAMLAVGVNQVIGLAWQHPRPFAIGLGHAWIPHAADSSFPSDHVTVLAGVGLSLLTSAAVPWAILMFALALVVSWARIFLGVHFPLDMLGAFVVAGITLLAVTPIWWHLGARSTDSVQAIYRYVFRWPIAAGWVKN